MTADIEQLRFLMKDNDSPAGKQPASKNSNCSKDAVPPSPLPSGEGQSERSFFGATNNLPSARGLSRRKFMLASGAAASAFAIVPRQELGGAVSVAPNDKITLACIGFGTQAIREVGAILARPEVQIVAMCDVEKDGLDYLEWGKNDIRNTIRRLIDNPTWRETSDFVPGGRDVGK